MDNSITYKIDKAIKSINDNNNSLNKYADLKINKLKSLTNSKSYYSHEISFFENEIKKTINYKKFYNPKKELLINELNKLKSIINDRNEKTIKQIKIEVENLKIPLYNVELDTKTNNDTAIFNYYLYPISSNHKFNYTVDEVPVSLGSQIEKHSQLLDEHIQQGIMIKKEIYDFLNIKDDSVYKDPRNFNVSFLINQTNQMDQEDIQGIPSAQQHTSAPNNLILPCKLNYF